jgi:Phosphotransferase enzyme family
MPARLITSSDQVDPAWLTEALLESGALQSGRVVSFDQDAGDSNWSRTLWLSLWYDSGATGERPGALLLKICADPEASFGPSEFHYYTRDYRGYPAAPLVRCFHAVYQATPRAYHLLLEDVRGTHADGFQVAPTLELARATADALARLHARYWGSRGLSGLGLAVASGAEVDGYFAHVAPGLEPLLESLGELLPEPRRRLLRLILAAHPRLLHERIRNDEGFTLVHGDVNPGNVLWPKVGSEPVYLIDRQPFDWSLQRWLGASDLARLMIIPWRPEQRREWETPVLQQYQESLRRFGIELPWGRLIADYRLAALESVEIAVEWCADPVTRVAKRGLWEWQLGRALQAVEDLGCAALLESGRLELP